MIVKVITKLRKGIADPEGENTKKALQMLGYPVTAVSCYKIFEIEIDAKNRVEAKVIASGMCKRLLTNPVIHDYEIIVENAD